GAAAGVRPGRVPARTQHRGRGRRAQELPAGHGGAPEELHAAVQRRAVQVRHGSDPRGGGPLRAAAREARAPEPDPAAVRVPAAPAAAGRLPARAAGAAGAGAG
ncbi:unnamed protein product, partial [Heterosigma akashiwo]